MDNPDTIETIECPHCGAPVQYQRGALSAVCSACGQPVTVSAAPTSPTSHVIFETPTRPPDEYPDLNMVIRTQVNKFIAPLITISIATAVVLMMAAFASSLFSSHDSTTGQEPPRSLVEPTRALSTKTPAPTPTPPTLETLLSFGTQGMNAGQFDDANNIVPDNAGHVYVSERHGGRIQVFDESGKFLKQWFVADAKPKTVITSLAADGKGNLFAATDDEILARYDGQSGKLLNQIEYAGGPGFTKIALMPNGGLAAIHSVDSGIATQPHEGVTDTLVIFDSQLTVTHVITNVVSGQTDEAEINLQIAVDGRDNIYIMGTHYTHQIFKFSPEGKFITRIGDPEALKGAFAFFIDNQNRLYANGPEMIFVYDETGRQIDQIPLDASLYSVVFDAHDNLWAISNGNSAVEKLKLLQH